MYNFKAMQWASIIFMGLICCHETSQINIEKGLIRSFKSVQQTFIQWVFSGGHFFSGVAWAAVPVDAGNNPFPWKSEACVN